MREERENIGQQLEEAMKKLAEYRNLEKQGRLLKLPCAVGDIVWINSEEYGVAECKVHKIEIDVTVTFYGSVTLPWQDWDYVYLDIEDACWHLSDFGKSVFLTRQEAKDAPEKRKLWYIATESGEDCNIIE